MDDPNYLDIIKHQDGSYTITPKNPTTSLIWMHGRGDLSDRYLPYFTGKQSPAHKNIRIRILQAPMRPITIQKGKMVPAWYDVRTFDRLTGDQKIVFNFEHVSYTMKTIESEIQKQIVFWQQIQSKSQSINKVPEISRRIYLGGFSQGGVMSLCYAMREKYLLGGAASFGGYMFRSVQAKNLGKLPILLIHGLEDNIIDQKLSKKNYERLLQNKESIYRGIEGLTHTVNQSLFQMLTDWIDQKRKRYELIRRSKL